jgi:hypothetical protein
MSVAAGTATVVQARLIKAIVLGGVCSVISWDAAEVVFACLDPVVERVLPKKGGNVTATAHATTSAAAAEVAKEEKKRAEEADESRRVMVKRIIRILLFTGVAYLMTSFIVDRLVK